MSFLAPFLFALAGFAAVPILLHLIRRKRIRILDFPTFRFLQKAALQQRMHLRLQDRLLMLLRILVILLLVLAFAGPLTSRALEPEGPVFGERNLLILDDSLSMSAFSEGGDTLYSKAFDYGRALTDHAQGDWRVALASEVDSTTGSDSFPSADPLDFFETQTSRSDPEARLSIYDILRKSAALADSKTVVWTLTDAAASNFLPSATGSMAPVEEPLNLLVVDKPANLSNWAIRELTLNNQPLLEGEPALLTAVFDQFGPPRVGSGPEEIEFAWKSEGDLPSNLASYSLTDASGTEGRIQTAIDVSGTIASVSCQLIFRAGAGDALAGDDSVEIFPRTLGDLSVTVLAESENWRKLLLAALVDYRVLSADSSQPPAESLEPSSAFVLLLGEKPIHDDWKGLVQSRLEAGAGVLVLYDDRASGLRIESWSKWWTGFGDRIQVETLEPGSREARGGASLWFSQSLQDLLFTQLRWAEGELELVLVPKWEGEWFLTGGTADFFPIFQTHRKGAGVAASFAVPLSLDLTPLILEPYWVPLLSQMVKRTLFDPEARDSTAERQDSGSAESALEPLSGEVKESLSSSGLRFIEAERFLADIEKIPSRSHDWTLICLMACLGLAILEIAVSNLV